MNKLLKEFKSLSNIKKQKEKDLAKIIGKKKASLLKKNNLL